MQLQSKLNLPLGYYGVGDHTSGAGAVRNERIRLLKYGMVECIEEFGPKFKIGLFGEVEEFSQREVRRLFTRSFENVFSCIAEAAVGAVWLRKVVDVEPQVGSRVSKMSIADLIRALQPRRACIAGVEINLRREGEAGTEGDDSA